MNAAITLVHDLASPLLKAGLDDLLALWRQDTFDIICDRPPDLEDYPDLALRVRGALGRALFASPGPVLTRNDPFDRPRAYDVIFKGKEDAGGVRPYALGIDIAGQQVLVRLAVFGEAMLWSGETKRALLQALYDGITLSGGHHRHKASVRPREVVHHRSEGIAPPSVGLGRHDVTLMLRSPLVIRHGNALSVTEHGLASSLLNRARDLAKWQGIDLTEQPSINDLTGFELHLGDTVPVSIERYSHGQKDRYVINGVLGRVRLANVSSTLLKLFAIAEVAHLGSHAGLGLGRIELAVYPTMRSRSQREMRD